MTEFEIKEIVNKQRAYFESGKTLDINNRITALKTLYGAMERYEKELQRALKQDLGKSAFEADMCEIRLSMSEITYQLKHIRKFSKSKRVATPIAHFHAKSYKEPSPYGTVLVMSPWNYPVLLSFEPLADAIAAGNTVILKPSAYSPETSKVIKTMLSDIFPSEFVSVVEGGREENKCLLNEHFDYIFFTGSTNVGKEVMRKAAEHLTPVTLELGGKSPCIVEKSADIALAARRIVFGKYVNCGQTCVAPDYILVEEAIRSDFINAVKKEIKKQLGESPLDNPDYGKLISQKHFDRVLGLIDEDKVIIGGNSNPKTLQIEPTVMDSVLFSDKVMQEEIFGPVMPIISFSGLDEALSMIKTLPHPLALYIFTKNKSIAKKVTKTVGFGGGCINDTIIHLATSNMGFGGFGESGMGSYHGKDGFNTFTHYKSIVDKKLWLDLPMRYSPYKESNHKLIRLFLK